MTTLHLQGEPTISNDDKELTASLSKSESDADRFFNPFLSEPHTTTSISDGAFDGLSGLKSLIINNQHLTDLTSKTFLGLDSLQYLDLTKNHVKQMENDTFSVLKNLKHLRLEHNFINNISPRMFSSNKQLLYLSLHYNVLCESHNSICDKNTFKGLESLEVLAQCLALLCTLRIRETPFVSPMVALAP